MNPPYGNPPYPQNPGFLGNPNIPPDLTQAMVNMNYIANSQAATVDILIRLQQSLETIQVNNALAQEQKEQAVFDKEEAFSVIEESSQGLVTYGKTRRQHVVLPVRIDRIYRIQMDSRYRHGFSYIIFWLNDDNPMVISQEEWKDSDLLLDALSSFTGHQVRTYGGQKNTARMLRNHLAARSKNISIPFFQGWSKADRGWRYSLINGSTHGNDDTYHVAVKSLSSVESAAGQIPSVSATMTMLEQITRFMDCITNAELRSLLFTWIHTASLSSLLQGEGFPIPMGLCLFSNDPRIVSGLERLMCWHSDTPVSFDLPDAEFAYRIMARKDQPLALKYTSAQSKNIELLQTAMSTGQIPSDKSLGPQRLQSLPTVISNTLGSLCFSSLFILVEITPCDLPPSSLAQFDRLSKYLPDYLLSFSAYVAGHIDALIYQIEMALYSVHSNCPADYPISQAALTTAGILSGIQQFVWDFHKNLAPSNELLAKLRILSPQKPPALLMDALSKSTAFSDTSTAIASQFCATASRWITDGSLDLRNISGERMNKPKFQNRGIIYRDTEFHYVTRIAFTAICKATGNSGPNVLSALREEGILTGAQTHDDTFQTRKTIEGRSTAIYKLDSTMLDDYAKIEG